MALREMGNAIGQSTEVDIKKGFGVFCSSLTQSVFEMILLPLRERNERTEVEVHVIEPLLF